MNAIQLLAHFNRLSEAPGAVKSLRRFILDLAVQGKLVAQDANDEPATVLLKRIEMERARLVKAGEIRKSKQLPPIDEEDEPYAAPAGWLWVRIRHVTSDRGQTTPAADFTYIDVTSINKEVGRIGELKVLSVSDAPSRARKAVRTGDVLYSCVRPTLLNIAIVDRDIVPTPIASTAFAILNGFGLVISRYLWIVLRSPYLEAIVEAGMRGQAYPAINDAEFSLLPLALPPLAEQHRIVAKVDELMALCDQLEAAQQERERRRDRLAAASLQRLNQPAADTSPQTQREHARFHLHHLPRLTTRPEHIKAMRQLFLDLAVRGKLLGQDSTDEPATELLRKIQLEKLKQPRRARKNEVKLLDVDLTLAPYELPTGWTWVRFPEVGTFGRGKSKHRPRNDAALFDGGRHLLVQTGDVARSKGVIKTFTSKYNDVGLAQSMKWPAGTLCITIAANIADSGILSFDACFPDSVVGFSASPLFDSARYFEYFVRTAKANLLEFAPATAQKNINLEILNAVLIPLPPLAEQHRIVAKVDSLMALCDQLEAQLSTTQTDSRRLLEAVLDAALMPA
jgi:type I restriction enzyme, S subunit